MKLNPKDFYFLNHCLPHERAPSAPTWPTRWSLPHIEGELDQNFHDTSGNSGNTYIMHCICKMLFGRHLDRPEVNGVANLFNSNLRDIDADAINKEYKCVLINMQDQLRPHISYIEGFWHKDTNSAFIHINNFLEKLNIPILCFGLGANCFDPPKYNDIAKLLHDSQKTFVKIISEKSKAFSIRGKFTKRVMDEWGIKNYAMVGCPTFYLEPKNIKINLNLQKIVITGWSAFVHQKKMVTPIKVGDRIGGTRDFRLPQEAEYSYLCQDEKPFVEMAFNAKGDRTPNGIEMIYFTKGGEAEEFFKDKDLAIGGRVHGSIMALNNGVPAICINVDSRATEVCDLFKIPHLGASPEGYDDKDIYEMLSGISTEEMSNNYSSLKIKHDEFIADALSVLE